MIFGTLINDIARYDSIIAKIIVSGNEIDKIINLTNGLSEAESISVMTKAGLNEKTIEHVQAMKLDSSAKAKDIIATNAQTNAQISNMGVVEVLKLKYQGLAASIGISTAALTTLIGVGIGLAGVGVALFKIAQVADDVAEKANTLSEEFNSSSTSIDDFKKQIDKLHAVINDDTSSFEEVKEARISLLSVQDEIISKFGDEKEVIDIVTDAINNQSSALDKLTQKEWTETLNDFNKEGFWNGLANRLAGYSDNVERMLASYGDYSVDVDLTGLMAKFTEDKYSEFAELITNKFGATILPEVGVATFTGNASEIYDTLLEIQNLSDEFDFGDAFNRQLTKAANNTKDVVSEYEGMYNQYILYEEVLPNYAEQYNQLTGAYKEYKEAWSSGDVGAQDKAIESLSKILQDASDNIDNKHVVEFFENMYPDLQSVIDRWKFKVNIIPEFHNASLLQGKTKSDINEMLTTSGFQSGEGVFNAMLKRATDDGIVTGETSERIEQLLDLLVECGVILDDLTEKSSDTATAFDDIFALEGSDGELNNLGKLNEQVDELQTAWTGLKEMMDNYNKTGTITVDQFQELLSYGDEYLQYLMDEEGNLRLNEEALKKVAAAKIENMKADILQKMLSNLENITNEATARDFLADKVNNETLAIAENTEVIKDNITVKLAELAATEGITAATMTSIENYVNNTMSILDKLGDSISIGSFYGKDAEKDIKDSIDSYMSYMEASLNASKIDYQTYSREVAAFLKDMFDKGKISAEDYHNYTKQMLEVQKDIYDSALSAVDNLLDDAIEGYEDLIEEIEKANEALEEQKTHMENATSAVVDYIDSLIDGENDAIDKLNEANDNIQIQIDKYDSLVNVADRLYEDEQNRYQDEIDAIQDKIDGLQDEADAYELIRRKEQALYELERAQSQRNKKLYVGDKGYIYDVDQDTVRDAKQNVEDIKTEELISHLEDEQDALQKSIDALQEYRDALAEMADAYNKLVDERNTAELVGDNYADVILGTNLDDWLALKDAYINANDQMANNEDLIKDHEDKIKIWEEEKEGWSSLTGVIDEEINKQAAAEQFGADWEQQINEGRLMSFDEFKNLYLGINNQINDNTQLIDSYNEKIEYYNGLKEQWADITSVYEEEKNKLYAAQLLGADWEKAVLDGRLGELNKFKDEYIAIQKAIEQATYEAAKANYEKTGNEVEKPKPDPNPEEHGTRYDVVNEATKKVVASYDSNIDSNAHAKANAKAEEEERHSGESYKVVPNAYAKGGKNLKKQIAWTNEYDDEAILSPTRNAILTPIKAGDSVLNPEMTKNLWKWAEINPNMFNPLVKSMDYNNIPIRNDVQPLTISIGDIQLYGVQDVNDLGNQIVKRLPNVMLQAINKR